MTLLPSPELAKAITAVVMDHAERSIERSRTISSAGLEEAILSRLLFLNATAAMSKAGADDDLVKCASRLLDEMQGHPVPPGGWSHAISVAFLDLSKALDRLGKR